MPSLLIPLILAMVWAALLSRPGQRSIRDALTRAAILTALWSTLCAELLSLPHAFAFGPVLAFWLAPAPVLLFLILRGRRNLAANLLPIRHPGLRAAILITPSLAVLSVTFYLAINIPATTWDCLTYHLPRQLMWINQRGVQHFPCADLRLIQMPPLAEFISAQLFILAEGDRAANMVQWACFALSAVTASAIARDLGAKRPGQAFAALLITCLPAAATQAVNAKNDIVGGFFALALLQGAVQTWARRDFPLSRALWVGLSLGLLLLAKGTMVVVALPIGLFIAGAGLWAASWRAIPLGAAAVVLACAVNAGHWARNYNALGNPVALPKERGGFGLLNTVHSPCAVASVLVRNLALEAPVSDQKVNFATTHKIETFHRWIGLSPIDPATTGYPQLGYVVVNGWISDGNNPAPFHTVMAISQLAVGLCLIRRPRRSRICWPAMLMAPAAFFAFSFVLQWQPWHNRLLIPVFFLAAPVAAMGSRRWDLLRIPVALACASTVWYSIIYNEGKPLVDLRPTRPAIFKLSREQQEFYREIKRRDAILQTRDLVAQRGSKAVAIRNLNDNAYALLRELTWHTPRPPRIYHLHAPFGPNPRPPRPPLDVIAIWPDAGPRLIDVDNHAYAAAVDAGGYKAYVDIGPLPGQRDEPHFQGFASETGISPPAGPYAVLGYPRRGGVLSTHTFTSDGLPTVLVLEAFTNRQPDQWVEVYLNDELVHRLECNICRDSSLAIVPLKPHEGENTIELHAAPGDQASGDILYLRLELAPPSQVPRVPDPPAPAAPQ